MKPRLPYTAHRLADARLSLKSPRPSLLRVFRRGRPGPARIDLLLIARRARAISAAVESLCDSFVTANIRRHDKMLEKARKAFVKTGQDLDSSSRAFSDLHARVGNLALFFRELDRRAPRVRSRLLWAFSQVHFMEKEQKEALGRENAYREELLRKRRQAEAGPEVRVRALDTRIMLCQKRIGMLTEFFQAFGALRPAMNRAAASVDRFQALVRENRRVFEEAEATLAMKKGFDAGLFTLSSETAFSGIAQEMARSFSELADAQRLLLAKAGSLS